MLLVTAMETQMAQLSTQDGTPAHGASSSASSSGGQVTTPSGTEVPASSADAPSPQPLALGQIRRVLSPQEEEEGRAILAYLFDEARNEDTRTMSHAEFHRRVQIIVNDVEASTPPLPVSPLHSPFPNTCQDPFTREGYAARLALLRKLERQPTKPLPTIRMFLKGAVSALELQYQAMEEFKDKLRSLRPLIDAIHPVAYNNVKILLTTGMEGNADLRTRMDRLILRIECRRASLITANIASHLAGDLFTEGVASLRKTAWWMIDDDDLLRFCGKFAEPDGPAAPTPP